MHRIYVLCTNGHPWFIIISFLFITWLLHLFLEYFAIRTNSVEKKNNLNGFEPLSPHHHNHRYRQVLHSSPHLSNCCHSNYAEQLQRMVISHHYRMTPSVRKKSKWPLKYNGAIWMDGFMPMLSTLLHIFVCVMSGFVYYKQSHVHRTNIERSNSCKLLLMVFVYLL